MREIKFRAWDGQRFHLDDFFIQCGIAFQFGEFGRDEVHPKDWILEQFTGFLDINGQEIYEGDILAWRDVNGFRNDKAPVEWVLDHGAFMLVDDDKNIYDEMINFFPNDWIEVAGNIHQPPKEAD